MHKIPFVAILTANTALPYSSLAITGDAFRYWAMPIVCINSKGHKLKLREVKITPLVIYGLGGGHNTHTHTHTHTYLDVSDFRKSGTGRPVADVCLVKKLKIFLKN